MNKTTHQANNEKKSAFSSVCMVSAERVPGISTL